MDLALFLYKNVPTYIKMESFFKFQNAINDNSKNKIKNQKAVQQMLSLQLRRILHLQQASRFCNGNILPEFLCYKLPIHFRNFDSSAV